MSEQTVVHLLRHGEVLQPRQDPLRPAARLPAVRRRRWRWRRRPPTWFAGRDVTLPGVQPAGARAADRRADRRGAVAAGRDRRAADRGRQRLRGAAGRRRRRRPARSRGTGGSCATRSAPRGGSPTSRSPRGCWPRSRPRATPPAGTRPSCVSHQLPIWTLRLHLEGRRYVHDPRRRQCGLASVTSLTYDGDRMVGVAYAEPAGATDPDAVPGRMRRSLLAAARGCPARRLLHRLRRGRRQQRRRVPLRRRHAGRRGHPGRTSGRRAPEFSGTLLDGEEFSSTSSPGTVAVLNFWGSWCAPCRVETPEFQEVYADVRRRRRRSSSG